jgi:hypothetical protein
MKNSSHRNRNRHLPACSAVHQATAPPRASPPPSTIKYYPSNYQKSFPLTKDTPSVQICEITLTYYSVKGPQEQNVMLRNMSR